MDDTTQHTTIVHARLGAHSGGQQRLDPGPLRIGKPKKRPIPPLQYVAVNHGPLPKGIPLLGPDPSVTVEVDEFPVSHVQRLLNCFAALPLGVGIAIRTVEQVDCRLDEVRDLGLSLQSNVRGQHQFRAKACQRRRSKQCQVAAA
jgi:hypothetical protein